MGVKNVVTVARKELAGYFASPVGYVFIVCYLLLSNGFFFYVRDFFAAGQASMREYFAMVPWLLLFFIPSMTMRLWAEEKKTGTLELLLTLPLRESEAVLGKFAAGLLFLAITMGFTWTVPFSVAYLGRPDWGVIAGAYIGTLLIGSAYLAVGLWVSSLTDSQVTAFVATVAALFALLAVGLVSAAFGLQGALASICEYLSLYSHFQNVARGVVDSRDIVYYVSVSVFFLWLNARNLEARKWR